LRLWNGTSLKVGANAAGGADSAFTLVFRSPEAIWSAVLGRDPLALADASSEAIWTSRVIFSRAEAQGSSGGAANAGRGEAPGCLHGTAAKNVERGFASLGGAVRSYARA